MESTVHNHAELPMPVRRTWLGAEVGVGGNHAELLRRAVTTPNYVLIFAVVPPSATATYCEVGFQPVGVPSKKMCGVTMYVMQHGSRRR